MLSAKLQCGASKALARDAHKGTGGELFASLNEQFLAIEWRLNSALSKSHAARPSMGPGRPLSDCSDSLLAPGSSSPASSLSCVDKCCELALDSSSSAFSSGASSLKGDHSPAPPTSNNHTDLPLNPIQLATKSHDDLTNDSTGQQAGMPRRSRSLVDDARMETQRNRQLLDEIRTEQLERRDSLLKEGQLGPLASSGVKLCAQTLAEQPEFESQSELANAELQPEAGAEAEVLDEAQEIERCLAEFPRHISELDHCNHLLIKYEPELDPTHPGFHDLEYRARRKEVAEVAFNYRHGERIPEIGYSEKEQETWKTIYLRLKEAYKRYACEQHNLAIRQLEEAAVYSPESVPQLQAVSEFLERKSGWRLRPVAGLLSARDFLASLAFRVFQTTQYIRHWANPEHSVEPDCIHELMGHIPMLCDPEFAHFSQELGLASLGASDEQIERFATLYWFTVEFGLCQEAGRLKCYGAGLLSSYGEMEHALESGKPQLSEFVPEETALQVYDDSEYQVVYYVARSFEEAKAKVKLYANKQLKRDYELAYDPYTCSVVELKSCAELESYAASIRNDLTRLTAALGKLKAAA